MTSQSRTPKYLIGIMSGTSCDAIDVAVVHAGNHQLVHFSEYPMPAELRESCLRLAAPGLNEIDALGNLDRALGMAFAASALSMLQENHISKQDILMIANHGQTIRHRPNGIAGGHPFTLQLGCAASLAELTGITVVSDFRSRDIAAGGEGAPLVPFAHQQLFSKHNGATAILNIGGIANITMLYDDGSTQGFDTGPGNMLMDALALQLSDGRYGYDKDGGLAATGTVCQALLKALLSHRFIKQQPPKSTGRETFGEAVLDRILAWPALSDADRMATTCMFTVQSIVEQISFLKEVPKHWLICGGGAFNSHLMQSLALALAPAKVCTSLQYGIPAEAVEAISFALLGKQTLLGKHNTLNEVTGARHPVCAGQITPGNNWRQVTQWVYDTISSCDNT
ncbi:MAG: anhydro-N-acetylmuramic acid kinase [Mariprofundaceae bacterium]|nr:anhydro-N-acetylmuramic acid kinase [Mariprofundaceae bacterium]